MEEKQLLIHQNLESHSKTQILAALTAIFTMMRL